MRITHVAYALLACLYSTADAACPYKDLDARSLPNHRHLHLKRDGTAGTAGKKGTMLINRLMPGSSMLFIANSDGTKLRPLLDNSTATMEYHASFSPDGKYVTFTSERRGLGQADVYRVGVDGTGLTPLLTTDSVEDQAVLSPDGTMLAYVSSAEGWKANIWVMDLESNSTRCLTNTPEVKGDPSSPDGYFKPAWSPDGQYIAFSSDRNTEWTNHRDGAAWEHTQELSIYVIRPDGTDFKKIVSRAGHSLGSPKWSPDGTRIVYYDMLLHETYNARSMQLWNDAQNQIWSVDVATGETRQETNTYSIKVNPQILPDGRVAYQAKKSGDDLGFWYDDKFSNISLPAPINNPSWSADGKQIVFEGYPYPGDSNVTIDLFSWQPDWVMKDGRQFNILDATGDEIAAPDENRTGIALYDPATMEEELAMANLSFQIKALTNDTSPFIPGIQQVAWSPDKQWIAFGAGGILQARREHSSIVWLIKADGTGLRNLTDGSMNCGYPSYSHDGNKIVYRAWGPPGSPGYGLYVIDLVTSTSTQITSDTMNDNLPSFSPDGERIVFTRRMNSTNYDICTVRPDGSDLQVLTSSGAVDGHATWTADGRITWSSGASGWLVEAATYFTAEQPYGQVWIMDADGSNKQPLTDTIWEEAMPLYLPGLFP